MDKLYIVNYCHPNCVPLYSITRLPESEAYAMAKDLSTENKGTAFGRFADFKNYYPKRIRTERWLHDWFIATGGEPTVEHPLYFVLHGSDYLDEWFDKGKITHLSLDSISSKHVSFTFGDSMAQMDKTERKDPFTKEILYGLIQSYNGTMAELFSEIGSQYRYIEVQLWNDHYCT